MSEHTDRQAPSEERQRTNIAPALERVARAQAYLTFHLGLLTAHVAAGLEDGPQHVRHWADELEEATAELAHTARFYAG